jgi:DNA-binding XRE family transcriptional regulator
MTPAEFRAARLAWGLTQVQLAKLLGHPRQAFVSYIETGARPITPPTEALMRAFLGGHRPEGWPAAKGGDA